MLPPSRASARVRAAAALALGQIPHTKAVDYLGQLVEDRDLQIREIARARLMLDLKERGIQTQVHYIPVHYQPYYTKNFGTNRGDCPNAENYYERCLSIPLHPAMMDQDIKRVVDEIKNITEKLK